MKKDLDWCNGADLEDHTKKKHTILKKYFRQYLITRCQHPQQEKFRLAIIDGFAGGGLYKCGSFGSPLIFVDVLAKTTDEINLHRSTHGMRPIKIECLLILNDDDKQTIELLKKNIAPLLLVLKDKHQNTFIEIEYLCSEFENIYSQLKQRLHSIKCGNVIFNLDQYGYSHVPSAIVRDILNSWRSAEVLLTFMIRSLLTYLSPKEGSENVPLEPTVREKIFSLLQNLDAPLNKDQWLGEAEKIVYSHYKYSAPYVSPFSINNPQGWRYWLMHFANSYRARQVYNDILHQDAESQAHFGRSGLNMLAYDPQDEGQLYLFNKSSRQLARDSLHNDIPRLISESGDAITMQDFYAVAYSETPAHSDDIHEVILENPDMEILTELGGKRRKPKTIKPTDILKLKNQTSMFSMFSSSKNKV